MARGLTSKKIEHGLSLTALDFRRHHQWWQQHINPNESTLLNNIPQPDSKIQFTQQSTSQNLLNPQSLKMQFTTLISAFVFAATALAAPAPVAPAPVVDSSIKSPAPVVGSSTETQTGATTWEIHPFLDASCQTPTGNTLGGSQAPGSQCINVTQRYGDKVYSAASTQGCKGKFPPPPQTDLW